MVFQLQDGPVFCILFGYEHKAAHAEAKGLEARKGIAGRVDERPFTGEGRAGTVDDAEGYTAGQAGDEVTAFWKKLDIIGGRLVWCTVEAIEQTRVAECMDVNKGYFVRAAG